MLFRVKEEANARIKAFADDQKITCVAVVEKCLTAYKKHKPLLNETHEFNCFRSKTKLIRILSDEKIPDEIKGNSKLFNEIVLWWTDKNGKYPKPLEQFVPTEKFIIEDSENE